MDADHRLVHPAMEQVAEAARASRASGTTATTDVLAAIDALEAVLYPHLAREEDETMPVVAASITAADWHRWDREHNIKGLSFRELAATGLWTLDGQDPASHALMRQVVPRPVMFVIDKVFGPRYRRKSARLWGGTRTAVVPALDKQLKEVTP
jgi:hypothetical protein